jgi:alpha-ribazole phosphatase
MDYARIIYWKVGLKLYLYMIRHGETVWNRDLLFTGQSDIELTERGLAQAAALGRRLAGVNFAGVYASDLRRALETARIVSGQDVGAITADSRLREANFGEWEGASWASLSEKCPEALAKWRENPADRPVPGGECFRQLQTRTVAAMREIIAGHNEGNILVVSHAGTIRMYLAAILGADINQVWRMRQDNAALNILQVSEGEPFINLLNDTTHLEGI